MKKKFGENIIKLIIIGDSIASIYTMERYPRTGWGQVFQKFFIDEKVVVENKAISGRSTRSFYNEGSWEKICAILKQGDYVFIQFGHNEAKTDRDRETLPFTTFKDYLKIYIDNTREKGAVPVLLTPVPRNKWENGKMVDTHGDYPKAAKEFAREYNVPIIDVHQKAKELLESMGEKKMDQFFLILRKGENHNYPEGIDDNTHLQESGAIEICRLITNGIRELKLDLEAYLINYKN